MKRNKSAACRFGCRFQSPHPSINEETRGNIDSDPLIGLVGVCAAGKTTITAQLRALGIRAKAIAQEHSYVADMWLRLTHPEILIFLDVSYPVTIARRNLNWTREDYLEQHRRLRHARQHADLYIFTDPLTPHQVVEQILAYIDHWQSPPNG